MKALLLNDWYMTKKYSRSFLLIIVVFVAVFAVDGNPFFLFFPVMFTGMMPVTLITFGEAFHWDRYVDSMPLSRRCYVASKYVFALIAFVAVMLFVVLSQVITYAIKGGAAEWSGFLSRIPLLVGIALLSPAVLMPFVFRFGAEKGRIAYFVAVGVMTGLGMILFDGGSGPLVQGFGGIGSAAIIAASLALFAVSWLLSVRFYEKREL